MAWVIDGWTCKSCKKRNWPWMKYCGWCKKTKEVA